MCAPRPITTSPISRPSARPSIATRRGFLAPRAAAFEHRIAALVADPGQWDQRDAIVAALSLSPADKATFPDIDPALLAPMEERLTGPHADPMLRWRLMQRPLRVRGVSTFFDYLNETVKRRLHSSRASSRAR
jgi:hypothetical protein